MKDNSLGFSVTKFYLFFDYSLWFFLKKRLKTCITISVIKIHISILSIVTEIINLIQTICFKSRVTEIINLPYPTSLSSFTKFKQPIRTVHLVLHIKMCLETKFYIFPKELQSSCYFKFNIFIFFEMQEF